MKELHVKSLLPVRLDKYLMDQFPALGMGRLNKALRENKIKLNGKKQPLSTRVQNGDIIKLFLNDDQLENRPTPAAVFVYEDDDIIIASKPAGIAVDGPDSDTLLRRVQTKLAAEGKAAHAVLCHRLDTGTSGLVLLAKNSSSIRRSARGSCAFLRKSATRGLRISPGGYSTPRSRGITSRFWTVR